MLVIVRNLKIMFGSIKIKKENSLNRKNFKLYILFLIISTGIFLRIYNLGRQSIWLDEARAFFRANKSVHELWSNQIKESNPPLYDILLHYFLRFINKKDEFHIRFFSAIMGILLIPLSFIAGRSLFGQRVGLFSSLLVAISPYHIYYSQDTKMYTFLSFLSLASFFIYYLALERDKVMYWCSYALITILLIYCHNYGFLLFLTQIIIFVIFYKKYPENLAKFLLINQIIFIFSIPRINCISQQILLDYNPWIRSPSARDVVNTFTYFSLLSWHLQLTPSVIIAFIIGLPIYLFLFGMAILVKNGDKYSNLKRFSISDKIIFIKLYLFIPLLLAMLFSLKKPIFVSGRYDMVVFPAFCLLISFALNRIKKDVWRTFLIRCIVIATSVCLYNYYFIFEKSNDRTLAHYLQTKTDRDTILVFTGLSLQPTLYYCEKSFLPNTVSFPEFNLGWLPRAAIEAEKGYVNNEIKKLKNKIKPFMEKNYSLWVIYINLEMNQLLIEELKKDYRFSEVINFTPGRNDSQVNEIYIFRNL